MVRPLVWFSNTGIVSSRNFSTMDTIINHKKKSMCDQINAKSLRQGNIIRFPPKTSPETPNVTLVAEGPGRECWKRSFFLDIISHPFLKLSVKPSPWLAPQKIEEGFSSYLGLFYKNVTDVTRVEFFCSFTTNCYAENAHCLKIIKKHLISIGHTIKFFVYFFVISTSKLIKFLKTFENETFSQIFNTVNSVKKSFSLFCSLLPEDIISISLRSHRSLLGGFAGFWFWGLSRLK